MVMKNADVEKWLTQKGEVDAAALLDDHLPGARQQLSRLDAQMRKLLSDIRKEFPDAVYFTGGGGFRLLLGFEEGPGADRSHKVAWSGQARIEDGDF